MRRILALATVSITAVFTTGATLVAPMPQQITHLVQQAQTAAIQAHHAIVDQAITNQEQLAAALQAAQTVEQRTANRVADPETWSALHGAIVQAEGFLEAGIEIQYGTVEVGGEVVQVAQSASPTSQQSSDLIASLREAAQATLESNTQWGEDTRDAAIAAAEDVLSTVEDNVDHAALDAAVQALKDADSVPQIASAAQSVDDEVTNVERAYEEWQQAEKERKQREAEEVAAAAAAAAAAQRSYSTTSSSTARQSGSTSTSAAYATSSGSSGTQTTSATAQPAVNHVEYVNYSGWQDELNACGGSVSLVYYPMRVIGEHWSCGGSGSNMAFVELQRVG